MPAKSEKQREAMAIALHAPDKLYARNKGMLSMPKTSLRDFAASMAKKKKKKYAY